jgi:hypothetical protein
MWEKIKSEPKGRTFHEEPSNRWREIWTPTRSMVFAIWGLEECEGDEGWWCYEKESDECVVEE